MSGQISKTEEEGSKPDKINASSHAATDEEYGDEYSVIPVQPIGSNEKYQNNFKSANAKRSYPKVIDQCPSSGWVSNQSRSEMSIPIINETLLEPEQEKEDEPAKVDEQVRDIENAFQDFFKQAKVETLQQN